MIINYQLISTIHIVVSRKCSDHLTIHLVLLSSSVCRLEGRRPSVFVSICAVRMYGGTQSAATRQPDLEATAIG